MPPVEDNVERAAPAVEVRAAWVADNAVAVLGARLRVADAQSRRAPVMPATSLAIRLGVRR